MSKSARVRRTAPSMFAKTLATAVLLAAFISLPGCISKTKVYTADKTLAYGSSIYNLSNVQRLGSRVEATLSDGSVIDIERMDKSGINALLKENSSITVATYIEMDDKDFTYQRSKVSKYSEYSRIIKNQESAMEKIRKFMANKKSTQLKLK